MKLISRNTQVALDVLQYLYRNDKRVVSSREVAEALDESPAVARHVLWTLRKANLVRRHSRGYRTHPSMPDLSTSDVLKAFGHGVIQNPLRGDKGASNRLLFKLETVLYCTSIKELLA